jgi:hypothetical protein
MELLRLEEKDDGSATMELEISNEELEFLVSYAIRDLLKKKLEEME